MYLFSCVRPVYSTVMRWAQAGTRPSLWRQSQVTRLPHHFCNLWCCDFPTVIGIWNGYIQTCTIKKQFPFARFYISVIICPLSDTKHDLHHCSPDILWESNIWEWTRSDHSYSFCFLQSQCDAMPVSVCSDETQRFARAFPRCSHLTSKCKCQARMKKGLSNGKVDSTLWDTFLINDYDFKRLSEPEFISFLMRFIWAANEECLTSNKISI